MKKLMNKKSKKGKTATCDNFDALLSSRVEINSCFRLSIEHVREGFTWSEEQKIKKRPWRNGPPTLRSFDTRTWSFENAGQSWWKKNRTNFCQWYRATRRARACCTGWSGSTTLSETRVRWPRYEKFARGSRESQISGSSTDGKKTDDSRSDHLKMQTHLRTQC